MKHSQLTMSDAFDTALLSLRKFRMRFVRRIRGMIRSSNLINRWKKRRQSKRMHSDHISLTLSFSTMEQTNQLKHVFGFLDANGDGKISSLEMRDVLLRLGHEQSEAGKEAEGMVREMDRDGDGFVDVDEFIDVVNRADNEAGDEIIIDAFTMYDEDKNGFVSAKQLQRVLTRLGCGNCSLRKCREMISGVDRNGDGLVDFQEFRSMMTTQAHLD